MSFKYLLLVWFGAMVCAEGTMAGEPKGTPMSANAGQTTEGLTACLTSNQLLVFIGNTGNLFYDVHKKYGQNDGWYFPFTSVSDILSGVNTKTLVFDAGLWIGGQVGGGTRVAIAEYSSEFAPGPMQNGTFCPDSPDYRVYCLHRDSMATHPGYDYRHWPTAQGAPTDASGSPQLTGDHMAWAVYNDADPSLHYYQGGGTAPLGVEVQQTAWTYDLTSAPWSIEVFVKYKFYNKGHNTISNFRVAIWADPDIGGWDDDLAGCDTANGLAFSFNGTNDDSDYGTKPPAWGVKLIHGLVTPSPGDKASFDFYSLPDYRNLPISAFWRFISGQFDRNAEESFHSMQGLNPSGTPYTYLGDTLRFNCSGRPDLGTGDLDNSPNDRRFVVSCGPVDFLPGDSQQLVVKFVSATGTDRLNSLQKTKAYLNSSNPVPSCCSGTLGNINLEGIVDAADLSQLISYLTGGMTAAQLPCAVAANVDGLGVTDSADLSRLIAYLTVGPGGPSLVPCSKL